MTKLFDILSSQDYANLDELRTTRRHEREALQQAEELKTLIAAQEQEPPMEGELLRHAGLQMMAHKNPHGHAWISGRHGKSVEPEAIFENYRAGDTSGRWAAYLERTEIDAPKHGR